MDFHISLWYYLKNKKMHVNTEPARGGAECHGRWLNSSPENPSCWSYVAFVADEVAQVSVLHVGQNHQRRALGRQADTQQRQHVGVAEVLHDDALFQELGHLVQVCDAFFFFLRTRGGQKKYR